MIERTVCSEPIFCEHCGDLRREFIEYSDGCAYCSDCTLSNGDIDTKQNDIDEAENYKLYEQWLHKELEEL